MSRSFQKLSKISCGMLLLRLIFHMDLNHRQNIRIVRGIVMSRATCDPIISTFGIKRCKILCFVKHSTDHLNKVERGLYEIQ